MATPEADTTDPFQDTETSEQMDNTHPLGQSSPKYIFIDGMDVLHEISRHNIKAIAELAEQCLKVLDGRVKDTIWHAWFLKTAWYRSGCERDVSEEYIATVDTRSG